MITYRPAGEQAATTRTQTRTQYTPQSRMRIKFTNTDSTGTPVTRELSIMFEGERYEIAVAATGTANVPEAVGEHLVASERYAIEAYDEDGDGSDDGGDADAGDADGSDDTDDTDGE